MPIAKTYWKNINIIYMEADKKRCERARSVVRWLMFNGVSSTQKGIAEKLGYNHAALSQILNGKVPMSMKFIDRLCAMSGCINKRWLVDGDGDMLIDDTDDLPEVNGDEQRNDGINNRTLVRILENQTKVIDRLTIQVEALMLSARKQQEQIEHLKEELKNKG